MTNDNNIESRKNRMKWEETAYQISKRSDKNWKSYEGPKFAKKGGKCEKMSKIAGFFCITFLFLKNYNNMKRRKNWALFQEPACKISLKNIENWQSY